MLNGVEEASKTHPLVRFSIPLAFSSPRIPACRCKRATARFQSSCYNLTFISRVDQQRLSRNRGHAPPGHLRRRHAEVDRPSARVDRRPQLRPTECLCEYSTSAVADPHQLQSCGLAAPQIDGPYPSTAKSLGQRVAPTQQCPDWNSPLAGSVPTLQTHGCVGLCFALVHLELRKTPADMLVTLEKAGERYALPPKLH